MEHVRSDLGPPVRCPHLAAFLGLGLLLLADLTLEKSRAQDLERRLLVLQLRALVLAGDDDSRGQMRDADRGLGLVHVLSTRAGGAIRVDLQILGPDLDFRFALHFRGRVDEREGRLTPLLEIERRDTNEPMRAALGLQVSVCVVAVDRQGRAPESRLVSRRELKKLGLETAALGPAQIHANEHLGPIRGIGTADTCGDRDHRAPLVVRSRKLCLETRLFDLAGELRELARHVRVEPRVIACQLRELGEVLRTRAEALPLLHAPADVSESPKDLLRPLAVLPEIGPRALRL